MTIEIKAKHKSGFLVDSPLQPFKFPAGESHIKIDDGYDPADYEYFVATIEGHDPQDLFTLSMLSQVLGSEESVRPKLNVILPYLPAARADRGVPNLWTYVNFLVTTVRIDRLITVDPHSPEWENTYRNLSRLQTGLEPDLVVFPVERIIRKEIQDGTSDSKDQPYVGVIAPDKGAVDRATRAAHVMGVPVFRAEKTRDFTTGKLTGFAMQDELPAEGKLLIVDDICDGGGTFLGLAKATGLPKDRLDLWVTHGIFSKGLLDLERQFGVIHTTDSYFTNDVTYMPTSTSGVHFIDKTKIRVHKLTPYLYPEIDA